MELTFVDGSPITMAAFLEILPYPVKDDCSYEIHGHWTHLAADTIERLQDELETAKAVENTLSMEMNDLRAEVERLKLGQTRRGG